MTHDSPNSSATAGAFVVLGANRGAACLLCSSDTAVAGPKAAVAAADIDSADDQKDRLALSFRGGLAGGGCSAGLSSGGTSDADSPPSSAACAGRGAGFGVGAAGRRRWNTSLAPGPAAGTRSSTSRWRMRSDLTCGTPKANKSSQKKVRRNTFAT